MSIPLHMNVNLQNDCTLYLLTGLYTDALQSPYRCHLAARIWLQ